MSVSRRAVISSAKGCQAGSPPTPSETTSAWWATRAAAHGAAASRSTLTGHTARRTASGVERKSRTRPVTGSTVGAASASCHPRS
ncbi:MAG: hypothetical protein R2708_06365 [Vicinamibacterales bacterium]